MSVFRIPRARAWPKAESVAIFPLLDQYLIPGNNWPSSVLHARHDDFADTDEDPVGLPFMYLGGFENGFMEDEHAAAILRDGTTQIGPRKGGEPVGDWWEDHEESYTPLEDIAKLQSFGAYTSQTCEVNATKPKLPLKDSSSAFVAIRESPTTTTVCSGSSSENPIVRKRDSLETDELTAMSTTMTSFESNASSLRKVNIANLPECDETGHDVSDFGQSLRSLMEFPSEPDLSFLSVSQEIITDICNWLSKDIFRAGADPADIYKYAVKFHKDGFYSANMIQRSCTLDDIAEWMKKAHFDRKSPCLSIRSDNLVT